MEDVLNIVKGQMALMDNLNKRLEIYGQISDIQNQQIKNIESTISNEIYKRLFIITYYQEVIMEKVFTTEELERVRMEAKEKANEVFKPNNDE